VSDQKISPEAIPLMCEGVDFSTLDVDAREGFILSRLDGRTNVGHIISMSGLGREETIQILVRLVEKGIISIHQQHRSAASASERNQQAQTEPRSKEPEKSEREKKKGPRLDQVPEGPAFFIWIDTIYQEIENISHFELLGVDRAATPREIKKAYFKRSKVFHPDRFYRRADPEFKNKLKDIFKRTNTAFQTLSNEDKRREYEGELRARGAGVKVSTLTAKARLEEADWKKKRPDLPKISLDFSKDKKKKREEELLKKLKEGPFSEQIKKAQRFYEGAMLEIQKRNIKAARTNLKLAMQYDPLNPKYKEELARIEVMEGEIQAEIAYEEGLAAEEGKEYERAIRFFNEAVRSNPRNPDYLYKLAEAVLNYQNNFEKARSLCLKAIELGEGDPKYHFILGLAYKGLGQMSAAAIQFEKVLELDPKNKKASKELKAVRRY
jgi:curved DNA-binding protein CbpA